MSYITTTLYVERGDDEIAVRVSGDIEFENGRCFVESFDASHELTAREHDDAEQALCDAWGDDDGGPDPDQKWDDR